MQALKRLVKQKKGQAMVELALILPILLLLLFGCIEFGSIFGAYLMVNNLARDGARYGVVGHTDAQITDLIFDHKAWLDESKLEVDILPAYASRQKGDALQVTVNYEVELFTPGIVNMVPNPWPVAGECIMRME